MADSWVTTVLNNYDNPRTIVENKFNTIWANQEDGVCHSKTFTKPCADGSEINDSGLSIYARHLDVSAERTTTLYSTEHLGHPVWAYVVHEPKHASAGFSLISTSESAIDAVSDHLCEKIIEPAKEEDKTYIGMWHLGARGDAVRERRAIDTRQWEVMSTNYTPKVQRTLNTLMSIKPEDIDGRIVLMWGPAGTGKTTFLRGVANEWRQWASLEYVIDPENFLGNSDYMTQVLLDDDYEYDNTTDKRLTQMRWRLLILEDAGELIKADAKKSTGQGLSRLLNMTDGILGEGRNLLLAITTNDDITTLHPAVTRPGRCLAKAEIPAFTRDEAEQWLGREHSARFDQIGQTATLAELFHIKKGSGKEVITTEDGSEKPEGGQYL